ncbi:MAG: GDSL-type esterase/lipase family protein [Sedimenticola sp.]
MSYDVDMNLDSCRKLVLGESASSMSTLSTDSQTTTYNISDDQFETVLYRTVQTDCTTKIQFVSHAYYTCFVAKMESDCSNSISLDKTSFVSKVTTHTQGLKCDIAMDSHFKTVTVTGVGHKTWRVSRFPAISKSLFKRFVIQADTQMNQADDQQQEHEDDSYIATAAVNPIHTSTPVVTRKETAGFPTVTEQPISQDTQILNLLVEKINKMETDIKDLKCTLIKCMDKLPVATSYAAVVNTQHASTPGSSQSNPPPDVREAAIHISSESEYAINLRSNAPPVPPQRACQLGMTATQEIPVVISARPKLVPEEPDLSINNDTRVVPRSKSVLLIGDSILKGVNTRGLQNGVQKHSTSGATLYTLNDEISRYDLKVFSHVVIYIGGNDMANNMDIDMFQEKYDQLIGVIKCGNSDCEITMCKIAPRGDADVSAANASIARIAEHWKLQGVQCSDNTHDLFLDKQGIPAPRFYGPDSIHLSHAGTKRLLDAVNRSCEIVTDYKKCVFTPQHRNGNPAMNSANLPQNNVNHTANRADSTPYHPRGYDRPNYMRQPDNRNARRANGYGHNSQNRSQPRFNRGPSSEFQSQKRCYHCLMVGHLVADCWNF